MPRSSKPFKSRKRQFTGIRKQDFAKSTDNLGNSAVPTPGPSAPQPKQVSSSKREVSDYLAEYNTFEEDNNAIFDLIRLEDMENLLPQIATCSKCRSPLSLTAGSRVCLNVVINIICTGCGYSVSGSNSGVIKSGPKPSKGKSELNVRLAYAFRCIGKGKKCRKTQQLAKRKLEDQFEEQKDPNQPSYGAGMY
ncbi:hypothetical protein J6590_093570 [Homalodisca vitripennis]|nr:hypothetical protein J6590_093570 [Homalodisca vitripennis]